MKKVKSQIESPQDDFILNERLEYIGGNSKKFYTIKLFQYSSDKEYYVSITYGRIGTEGSTYDNAFLYKSEAIGFYNKKKAEKIKKGYVLRQTLEAISIPKPIEQPSIPQEDPGLNGLNRKRIALLKRRMNKDEDQKWTSK